MLTLENNRPDRRKAEIPRSEGTKVVFETAPGHASYAWISKMDLKALHEGKFTLLLLRRDPLGRLCSSTEA